MLFNRSMTFDGEEIERAAIPMDAAVRTHLDAEFIDKLKCGDEAAFETLVDRYSGDIYSLLYRITENAEEAADLTQDTFLRVLRSIKSFRGDSEIKTWLYRIAFCKRP